MNGNHEGGFGSCEKTRLTPLRSDWRSNKSAAVSAAFEQVSKTRGLRLKQVLERLVQRRGVFRDRL